MNLQALVQSGQAWLARRLLPAAPPPPELAMVHTMAEFGLFMRQETALYSPSYACQRVRLHGQSHLRAAAQQGGVVLAMLHHGSWILAGGAVVHQLRMPYTVVASRRSLDREPEAVRNFWLGVHQRGVNLYGQRLLYSDEPALGAVRWLQQPGHVLGVVLDVREGGKHTPEYAFAFCNTTVFLQTGPAKLARIAKAALVPMVTVYDPARALHDVHFLPAVAVGMSDVDTTQAALSAMEPLFACSQQQAFYDILGVCGQPAAN